MTFENRQHPRYALDVDCTIVAMGTTLHARTRNLSRSGISCMVPEKLAAGSEVMLDLALTFSQGELSEPIRLPATIMWCTRLSDAWQIGARFGALEGGQLRLLAVFIQFLRGLDSDEDDEG